MTEKQFKQLMGKMDRIIALLEAQQGKGAEPFTFKYVPDTFEYIPEVILPVPFGNDDSLPSYVYPYNYTICPINHTLEVHRCQS